MIVASFWVYRPQEFPHAADYPGMLRILQRSCDRLGLKHVVLTDRATFDSPLWPDGVTGWAPTDCPRPLMRAVTELQARFLEDHAGREIAGAGVAFVGADCIFRKVPRFNFEPPADLYVTYRHKEARYPINTGLVFVQNVAKSAPLFRRIADRCGEKWCDDQRAIRAELEPMPNGPGMYERAGLTVGFLPMTPYNVTPKRPDDPASGAFMIHFRGKGRKGLFFEWADKFGFTHD